jgi:hypothetical protein
LMENTHMNQVNIVMTFLSLLHENGLPINSSVSPKGVLRERKPLGCRKAVTGSFFTTGGVR